MSPRESQLDAKIVLIFTGGTISMVDDGHGASPALGGSALGAALGTSDVAVAAVDWGLVPGAHLSMSDLLSIADLIQASIEGGATGIVVVQGTDTIEETAWAWELMHAWEVPVVVTGAMRTSSEEDYDGTRNLHDAIVCAHALAGQRSAPVLVTFAGDVHVARDVTKIDALSLRAFASRGKGVLGRVTDESLIQTRPLPLPTVLPSRSAAEVEVVSLGIDSGLRSFEAAAAAGIPGIVLEAPGQGHTTGAVLRLGLEYMAAGGHLAITSRCADGPAVGTYGFEGGGRDWSEAGAVFTGALGAWKARTLMSLAIGSGMPKERIGSVFAHLAVE